MKRFEEFFRIAVDPMCIADITTGVFVTVNPAMCHALGYDETELVGMEFLRLVHPDDLDATLEASSSLVLGDDVRQFHNRYITKSGDVIWLSWCSRSTASGLVYAVARNVTQQKLDQAKREKALENMATHDAATGLLNRHGAELAIAHMRDAAALLIDVDDLKKVNERCGMVAGDLVLKDVAQRIRMSVRPTDVVFRFGGDEFVVLLPGASSDAVVDIARRTLSAIGNITVADQAGHQVAITASVGLLETGPIDSIHGAISKIECAIRKAKTGGKNTIRFASEPQSESHVLP